VTREDSIGPAKVELTVVNEYYPCQSSTSIGRRNGRRGPCPVTNRPSFLIAQLCIAVNQKIRLQRHVVAFDTLADLAEFFQPPRGVVIGPI
jgi:hypothetical protein